MRHIITISILILSNQAIGQNISFDVGCGDYFKLGKAVTVLELIEQGKVNEVYSRLPENIKVDSAVLEKAIYSISKIQPYKEGSRPVAFINEETDSFWYERTYYRQTNTEIEYQYQILIKLIEINGSVAISDFVLRMNDDIEHREKEIAEIDKNKVDIKNPPPPPGPPGLK